MNDREYNPPNARWGIKKMLTQQNQNATKHPNSTNSSHHNMQSPTMATTTAKRLPLRTVSD